MKNRYGQVLLVLGLCVGCSDGAEEFVQSDTVQQDLVFLQSDDVQGNTPVVSIVDKFKITSLGVDVNDVSWGKDDMEVSLCIKDTTTNTLVKCISDRDKSTYEGNTLLKDQYLVFDKGRNAYSKPGDVSPGTEYGLRLLLRTRDGIVRTTTKNFTCKWDPYWTDYNCKTDGFMGVAYNSGSEYGYTLALKNSFGTQSEATFWFSFKWVSSKITGTIPPRSSSANGDDGYEWHHFQPAIFNVGKVGARLKMSWGSADADLYGRAGNQPTLSTYSCRPHASGITQEECVVDPLTSWPFFSVRNTSTAIEARYELYLESGGLVPII